MQKSAVWNWMLFDDVLHTPEKPATRLYYILVLLSAFRGVIALSPVVIMLSLSFRLFSQVSDSDSAFLSHLLSCVSPSWDSQVSPLFLSIQLPTDACDTANCCPTRSTASSRLLLVWLRGSTTRHRAASLMLIGYRWCNFANTQDATTLCASFSFLLSQPRPRSLSGGTGTDGLWRRSRSLAPGAWRTHGARTQSGGG
jgi:hypothetical protein